MDSNNSSRLPGLPRLSKLPARPGSRAIGSIDEGPGAPSGIPGAGKPSSIAIPQRPGSAMRSYADGPLSRNRQTMLMKPGFQASTVQVPARDNQEVGTSKLVSPTSPESSASNLSDGSTIATDDNNHQPSTTIRKSRPSLSDRTMDTLFKVPPSPSPARRRQSGFFVPESPMRPPSRSGSALGFSQPGSRAGSSIPSARPASPTKAPSGAYSRMQPPATPGARRPISTTATSTGPTANRRSVQIPSANSRIQPPSPSNTASKMAPPKTRTLNGSKTMNARPQEARTPIKDVFGGPLTAQSMAPAKGSVKPLKPMAGRSLIGTPSQPRSLKKPQLTPKAKLKVEEPPSPIEGRKVSQSSQSLRATIAAARAAHRESRDPNDDAITPRSIEGSNVASIGPDADPASLDLMDSTHVNIVKKRINNARKDGKLNIAALCLAEIPTEVLKMYEYDPNDKSSSPWYESVDVTRLLAADNEFKELPSQVFPSGGRYSQDDPDPQDGIFTGLTDIDLHGNSLQALPSTMGNLPALTTLNLSRNQLGNESLEVISSIKSLRELRLAENKLIGTLPDCIGQLEDLLTFDITRNSVSELPASIGRLSNLSKLIVSENRLASIPFEALFDLQVTEISASRNKLTGHLFPANVTCVSSLKVLDVSTNALNSLTKGSIELPALQTLEVANNRISELPNVTTWIQLTNLNAEENKLSAFPEGFTKLANLKTADFGNNSLLVIEDDIGSMDTLISLNIKNNPVKERRLPRLGTEELKAELRNRRADVVSSTTNGAQDLTSPTAGWPISNGTLDRSNTRMQSLDRSDLEPLSDHQVTSLVLHHNQLPKISPAIQLLGDTLVSLDLSHNKLGRSDVYLTESLSLPNLQTLNLTSNGLVSIEPLLGRLSAPKLTALIIAFNRVKTLPRVCKAFPVLTRLIASNNAINELDVDSVRGLQVLDVSSNEIEHLPAKLAVLQGQLRTLVVTGNKFRVPGYAMLQKGTEEVLKWLRTRIPAGEEGAIGADEK